MTIYLPRGPRMKHKRLIIVLQQKTNLEKLKMNKQQKGSYLMNV